jgi:polar amino acid transport system substrate-binding protein
MIMRNLAFRMMVCLGMVCAGAWAQARTLDEILKAGEIRVGVNVLIPPRAQIDDKNAITGFDPDLANAIATKLGVKLTLVNVNGPNRIPYVATDRIDVTMGGMTRSADRAKVIDFTVPITGNNYGVMTRVDTHVTTLADLNRETATIAMARGTAVLPTVQAMLPQAKFILLDNIPDRDRALSQGRADAIVDLIDNPDMVKVYPDMQWKIFPTPEIPGSYDCLGVAKGNSSLRDWLNVAVWELHASGFIAANWTKWFGRPMPTPVPFSPFF